MLGYTAASELPWKLLKCSDAVKDGVIAPYHIQLIPTNRCNGNCPWCSCKDVDRNIELSTQEIINILLYFKNLGTKAVTITGGGEPTMHHRLDEIINFAESISLECGMVTNGLKICDGEDWSYLNYLTWMRVSVINTVKEYNINIIKSICSQLDQVDIGISFTVTDEVNLNTAVEVCEIAESIDNLTHIRFVQDILNLPTQGMGKVEKECSFSDKAIFQRREDYTKGVEKCLISKLKPVIDATGYIFPCCGVQYAGDTLNCMPDEFRMGHWSEFHRLDSFDGRICKKCYYNDYNTALKTLISLIPHQNFI